MTWHIFFIIVLWVALLLLIVVAVLQWFQNRIKKQMEFIAGREIKPGDESFTITPDQLPDFIESNLAAASVYIILQDETLEDLCTNVNDQVSRGLVPVGGVTYNGKVYCQAVFKDAMRNDFFHTFQRLCSCRLFKKFLQ